MEKLITLDGVNNIVNKLVSYINSVEAKALPEPKDWINENANNYKTTGIYHFKGYRKSNDDNLPIANYNPDGDTDNIAFTLIVDAVEGYANDASHIPGHIGQVLMLGNRKGSETKIYTRNCTKFYDEPNGRYEWESWSEVVTSRLLMINNFETGLNDVTEIGLYTGVNQTTGDVFKLEVINNYVPAGANGLPNTVLQTMTVVSLDGSYRELQRTKSPYTGEWTPWTGVKAGGAQFAPDRYYSLTTEDGVTYYTTELTAGGLISVGGTVYTDIDWTIPAGTVGNPITHGSQYVVLNDGTKLRAELIYYNKPNDKILATEAGVIDYVTNYEDPKVEDLQSQVNNKADMVKESTPGNLAGLDASGNLQDSGYEAGGSEIVEKSYLCFKPIGVYEDDVVTYYTNEKVEGYELAGKTVYSDAACTIPAGIVNTVLGSGNYSLELNDGNIVNVYSAQYNKISDKTLATEAGVMKAIQSAGTSNVSTPDWNQNNETATDYIKNRTHYEIIAEHVEMNDSEYNAKVASGTKFVQVKIDSVTVESNEYLKDESTETGSKQEYNSILSALSVDSNSHVLGKNGTSTCKKIAINGIETTLEYLEHPRGSGSPFYDREGVLGDTFYGADGTADATKTNLICCYGNGFMFKYYSHTYYDKGYFLYFIDKTIYGEAPYTIDFYFECERTLKKLDEKFLPDGIKPKHKTGDVVVCIDRASAGIFKVIPWEEYEANPLGYPDAIGLVADPVKRTFLFCELLKKPFASIANIKKYLYSYTSLIDGQDTYKRLSTSGNIGSSFPAFYDLRYILKTGTIFYQKQFSAYTPALFEWEKIYDTLCLPFYDDEENKTGAYGSMMDRLIALKNGAAIKSDTFFYIDTQNNFHTVYYAQLSSVGLVGTMDGYPYNDIATFCTTGVVPGYDTLNYNISPVFGLYSEDEE